MRGSHSCNVAATQIHYEWVRIGTTTKSLLILYSAVVHGTARYYYDTSCVLRVTLVLDIIDSPSDAVPYGSHIMYQVPMIYDTGIVPQNCANLTIFTITCVDDDDDSRLGEYCTHSDVMVRILSSCGSRTSELLKENK
jgi:hypothetical protein